MWQNIFANFKNRFWKNSWTPTNLEIFRWGSRKNILRKIISKPSFCCVIWSTSAKNMARFGFVAKKANLE